MSRYCSIGRYNQQIRNLKTIKENIMKTSKAFQQVSLDGVSSKIKWNFLGKILRNLSQSDVPMQDDSKVSTVQLAFENNHVKNKFSTKILRKHINKLCSNFEKTIRTNKLPLYSVAGLSMVENTSDPKIQPLIEPIPEPPPIPEGAGEILNQLNALGEPTFASLGLGGYSPVGLAQNCFEYLHVTLDLEWWAAIALGTLIIRICLFPLVVIAQRNAAKMNNYLPQMQLLQLKMTEARQTGNQLDAARYSQELMFFMKEKGLNPLKNMVVPLAQMPIFVSFFMALRQMTNVPVDSLRTGGLYWFTDLTLPDQYFLLPIITSATLYATIELGTDTAKLSSQNMQLMKYVLRGLPLVVLPFTVNFPGAILCYWMSSNFISLVQVGFLRIPRVRSYFNIEALRKIDPLDLPMKPKGFKEGIKDSWTNIKITKELEERRRLDEIKFQRAGKGPIVKTYKYDPTKQVEPSNSVPISAKKR
ncbi:unnamed protein product [Phaedon cochleariae]|uniref:Membrane insertase YidC/Oxa/ALB C-terminal domain-containing protein n=1 Tax=Phaedon cochleariae TaxID=80249 RepID=A0A9P0GXG5_PHACE|nr:unnamed protein product [Phaedon cochleariae]